MYFEKKQRFNLQMTNGLKFGSLRQSDCEFRVNMLETALKVNYNIIRKNQYARQQKWFQNLRSGFPLQCGIARLDFRKLMCASKPR